MSGIIYICFLHDSSKDSKIVVGNVKKFADIREIIVFMDKNTDSTPLHDLAEPIYQIIDQKIPLNDYYTSYDGFLSIINYRVSANPGCTPIIDISTANNIESYISNTLSMMLPARTVFMNSENKLQSMSTVPLPDRNKIGHTKMEILRILMGVNDASIDKINSEFNKNISRKTISTNVKDLEDMELIEFTGYVKNQHKTGPKNRMYSITEMGRLTYRIYSRY